MNAHSDICFVAYMRGAKTPRLAVLFQDANEDKIGVYSVIDDGPSERLPIRSQNRLGLWKDREHYSLPYGSSFTSNALTVTTAPTACGCAIVPLNPRTTGINVVGSGTE